MRPLTGKRAIVLKGILFLLAGALAAGLLILDNPRSLAVFLLAVTVFSFARFYYFAFYVVTHYLDARYRFSGLIAVGGYLLRRGRRPGGADAATMSNLFEDVSATLRAERVDVLLEAPGVRLERIVSTGHATPPGQWYDQAAAEWVVVLRGRAGVRFEDQREPRVLEPGDFLLIPARRRHRVEWTDPHEPTMWLALHVRGVGTPTAQT